MKENLTLINYKEPLRKVTDGYGYMGTISSTPDGEKIQCHVCGELFKSVQSHTQQSHKLSDRDYKIKFGLSFTTALISEKERERRSNKTVDWINSMTNEELKVIRKKALKGLKKYYKTDKYKNRVQPKKQLEGYNKDGTCPDQLLAHIESVAKKLGHTPSKHEFIGEMGTQRYIHLIYKVFGSWVSALKMIGMIPKSSNNTTGQRPRHSNEELLEYLKIFTQENDRIPVATDFRRGLLPSYEIYLRRFKSIRIARHLAGVE